MKNSDKYLIYTTAFNEENNIEKTIKSVIKQTILPVQWIIVDDGSTDRTKEIINCYLEKYSFITLISKHKSNIDPGAHVGINWQLAKKHISICDWEYIAQLDADIEIDRNDFYECLIKRFNENQKLGILSGITYNIINDRKILTKRPYWRTGGATKFYQRRCFENIGEILPIFAWDGIDVYKAMYKGWLSRTDFNFHVNHLAKSRMLNREKSIGLAYLHGKNLYQRGFPFEFVILKSFSFLRRSLKQYVNFCKGYYEAQRNKISFVTQDEKKFIRKIQYIRILDKILVKELL